MHPSWVHLGDVKRDGSAATSHGCAGTPVVALGSSTQPGSRPAVRAFHTWTPLPTVGSQHKCPIASTLPRGEPGSSITCSFTPSMTPREDACSYLQLLSSFTARIYRTVCDQPTVIASFFTDMGIQLEMYTHTHPISHSKDNGSELKCL